MMHLFEQLHGNIASIVTRGKVIASQLAARTLLQASGLDRETFSNVELLLPPGYCARPVAGADIVILEVGGLRDHKIALGGDNIADRVADLQPGEYGLARNGQRVILRQGFIEIVSASAIRLVAPSLTWSSDGTNFYTLATSTHTHADPQGGETAAPNNSPGMLT